MFIHHRDLGLKPVCQVGNALTFWVVEQANRGDTNGAYPNVEGNSAKSMSVLAPFMSPSDRAKTLQNYAYLPGLRESDPNNLIVMYMKKQTRYMWHGDMRAYRRELKWLVFSPDTDSPFDTEEWCPEGARRLSTKEFKQRLRRTLDYLNLNDRPYWTNVVREHKDFLNSIGK